MLIKCTRTLSDLIKLVLLSTYQGILQICITYLINVCLLVASENCGLYMHIKQILVVSEKSKRDCVVGASVHTSRAR